MKGKQTIELPYGTHRIEYATPHPILLSVDDRPVEAINTGSGRVVLRKFQGTLQLDPTEPKAQFKFDVTSKKSQPGETVDDVPPPQPAPPSNYLAKIRQQVKDSMGIMREEFDRGRTMYETGDIDLFEEDMAPSKQTEENTGQSASDSQVQKSVPEAQPDSSKTDEPGNPG